MSAAAVAERLRESAAVARVRGALPDAQGVWVVGGAVRDAALKRRVGDLDLAIAGDPETAAATIARANEGHYFELSEEYDTWRAGAADGGWQVDVSILRGGSIEADLSARDFTIGAVAVPLAAGAALDPHGGLADLERRVLRMVGPQSFEDDPLRLLRAARLAAELELDVEPETAAAARALAARADEPAGERQLAELRLLIGGPDPLRGLATMDELELTAAVLPEVEAMRGVEQNPNHHLDVLGHTLLVLERTLELQSDPGHFAGDRGAEVAELLREPLADGFTRGDALRLGAVLHDIGKPATRTERDGFVGFMGHDREGARLIAGLCERLRASRRLSRHLEALALHHLRLGFMVRERPLPPRRVYDYLRDTQPVEVDVTLLTVADRLAARGSGPVASDEMVQAHLDLAREMIGAGLDWRRDGPPSPLLRGDELAAELGIEHGPQLGELLAELEAASYAGEVASREEALAHARRIARL
jgi:poly(A) polymerase